MPASLHFSDQTAAAGLTFTHATPITQGDGAQMISGAAAGDFNNDGWIDLYVVGGGLRADGLFINQGDGTFADYTLQAGLGAAHLGSGAAVGDYDGDGWVDLFVTSFGTPDNMGAGHHLLFRNNGDLTFSEVAVEAGVNQASPELPDGLGASFGDYDLDGDLDLFVAGWRKPGGEPALGNRLFRNNGDGTFADVTQQAGIVDDGIRGFNPCFADMDGDRYPELLLSADFGTSRFYHNQGDGTFTDSTYQAGTHQTWSGMGSAVGDVNNDGRLDWFITAIYDDDNVGRGAGNTLYVNQGNGTFAEVASQVGVADGGWGWGTVVTDFNNDGLPDLVAVNGWDLESYVNERAKLWLQQPDGTFVEASEVTGFGDPMNQLGLFTLDYDNDGDQDVVVTAYNGELKLYRNDLAGDDTHWLRVVLDNSEAHALAPNGLGSRVEVVAGGHTYVRYALSCSHYLTQSEMTLHFGLGSAKEVERLTVIWPNGSSTVVTEVPVDQVIVIRPE
ncbi:MAG: CRTAC1 family protein [Caldilineaceae bacterium]|nr:CRTAC1 family protein [Caldilineaceae bacterium]